MTINDIIKETKTGYQVFTTNINFNCSDEDLKKIFKDEIFKSQHNAIAINAMSQKDLIKNRDIISTQYMDIIDSVENLLNEVLLLRQDIVKIEKERNVLLDELMKEKGCSKRKYRSK